MREKALRVASYVAAIPALPLLIAVAVIVRLDSWRRRRSHLPPRLIYGPVPILSFKFMARAMRAKGYRAMTVVHGLYRIHDVGDFDRVVLSRDSGNAIGVAVARLLGGDYLVFAWTLLRFDVFHSFFDGGFLRRTPLRFLEAQLLHVAGKRLIVMPYGSDVAVLAEIKSDEWREGLLRNYPALADHQPRIRRQISYYSHHADFIVACLVHSETLPRWDLLTTHYYPIDTSEWAPLDESRFGCDGRNGLVTVVHAPNHRGIKGTEHLIEACDALKREGLRLELVLLEGVPNSAVHAAMANADIVAEQFILGYALNAMEGMSLAKPVMSNLSDDRYYAVHRKLTGLSDCPIVSTAPSQIRDQLRALVVDPDRRRGIGQQSRDYVTAYHSLDAMANLWDAIYRRVWLDEAVDPADALPGSTRAA